MRRSVDVHTIDLARFGLGAMPGRKVLEDLVEPTLFDREVAELGGQRQLKIKPDCRTFWVVGT